MTAFDEDAFYRSLGYDVDELDARFASVNNGSDGAELDSSASNRGSDESNNSSGEPLPFGPLSERLKDVPPEPEWYWDGYVAPGALTLLAARPKVGKTTKLFGLTGAFRTGLPFIGRSVRKTGVLLLSEERHYTLDEKRRLFNLGDNMHLLMRHEVGAYGWAEVVDAAADYCLENGLGVLVIDTLDKWASMGLAGDWENSSSAVVSVVAPLMKAAGRGLAVIVVTHQRKSDGEHGDAVRGSNALVGAVDVVVELERPKRHEAAGDNVRVLRSSSRFASTPATLACELDGDSYQVCNLDERKAATERERAYEALGALEVATLDELAAHLEVPKGTVSDRLKELGDRVLSEGKGVRGDKLRFSRADSIRRAPNPTDESNPNGFQPELEVEP